MNKSVLLIILALLLIGGGVYFYAQQKAETGPQDIKVESETQKENTQKPSPSAETSLKNNIITYTDSGFEPNSLSINTGEMVTFENRSSKNLWVASAMHPTHRGYPGSDIEKCGTDKAISIFDACKGFAPNTFWTFTFSEKGDWKYHNHLNSQHFGGITVQ